VSWVVFAFSGPVLWAISVHLDKYLVERFFKESNVAVMLLFTAFVGVLLLPFIWLYEPSVTAPRLGSIALIILAGVLYMAAMLLYLQALQTEEASVVAPISRPVRRSAMGSHISCLANGRHWLAAS
jgi:drug/metabolite transporter (DMT)-like permease